MPGIRIFTGNMGATGFKAATYYASKGGVYLEPNSRTIIPTERLLNEGVSNVVRGLTGFPHLGVDVISLDAAGPLNKDGSISLTWLGDYNIAPKAIESDLSKPVSLVNDAVPPMAANLSPEDSIGIFPGTGLGFAYRLGNKDGLTIHPSEGGHPTMSVTNWLDYQFMRYLSAVHNVNTATEEMALRGASFKDAVNFLSLISSGAIAGMESEKNVPQVILSLRETRLPEWLSEALSDSTVNANKLITDVALGKVEGKQSLHCEVALAMWLYRLGVYTGNQIVNFLPDGDEGGEVLYSGGFIGDLKGNFSTQKLEYGNLTFYGGLRGVRESSKFADIIGRRTLSVEDEGIFNLGLANIALARFPELGKKAELEPRIEIK